ncbi:MAG TPA: hypothetical protein VGC14_24715 [Rhizobium sp.]
MKFLFEDESFSFETLRAAGFAADGGADLGEIIATAEKIPEGDETAWHREWNPTTAPPGPWASTSHQRRIIAPLDPLLRNGGIILQSVGFADVQICTFLRKCF